MEHDTAKLMKSAPAKYRKWLAKQKEVDTQQDITECPNGNAALGDRDLNNLSI